MRAPPSLQPMTRAEGAAGGAVPFAVSSIPAANVASVPQRSPLRYPGGKTWLIPHIRAWLRSRTPAPRLIEPFAGGGIVSLTAVMEGLAARSRMTELDPDVAAFWQAALKHNAELCDRIRAFRPTRTAVARLATQPPATALEHGFRTLVLNRTRRSGILAPDASWLRTGENGKGIASRWYAQTLIRRLQAIAQHADRLDFREADGLQQVARLTHDGARTNTVVFVDPPYTAGGKRAGARLYRYHALDHARLFALLADSGADFLMTYDQAPEIEALVRQHKFHAVRVTMKNAHHAWLPELVITPQPRFAP